MNKQYLYTLMVFIATMGLTLAQDVKVLNDSAHSIRKSNPELAIELLNKSFKISKNRRHYRQMGISKKIAADVFRESRMNESAYAHYTEALRLIHLSDTSDYFNTYAIHRNLSVILNRMEVYKGAANHLDSAISNLEFYIDEYPDLKQQGNILKLDRLGYLKARYLMKSLEVETATAIYFKLEKRTRENGNWPVYLDVSNELGLTNIRFNKFEEAIPYFKRMLGVAVISEKQRAYAYHNLGESYLGLGKPVEALINLDSALAINSKLGKRDYYLFYNHLQKGNAYLALNKPKKAISHYLKAIEADSNVYEDPTMYEVYYQLQLAGFETGDERTKEWGVLYADANKAFLKNQQEVLVNQKANVFQNSIISQQEARRKEMAREQALLRWASILSGLTAIILAFLLIKRRFRKATLHEMDYEDAVVTARDLLLKNYHKIYGAYDKYLADERCSYNGKKETLRKAMSPNGEYRNAELVEYVLNDLGEGKFKIKS